MYISVRCPSCQNRYQLKPELNGKRMRCPNPGCREVFLVRELTETPPPSNPGKARSAESNSGFIAGTVGEIVPMVPAEPVDEPGLVPLPPEEAEYEVLPDLPPPPPTPKRPAPATRRPAPKAPTNLPPSRTIPAPQQAPTFEPKELGPGSWEAPPVRRGKDDGPTEKLSEPEPAPPAVLSDEHRADEPASHPADLLPHSDARRRAPWLIVAMLLLVAGALGTGVWYLVVAQSQSEEQLAAEAHKDYAEGRFASAAAKFHQLENEHPDGDHTAEYAFWAQFSDISKQVSELSTPPDDALAELRKFLKEHDKHPLLRQLEKQHPEDLANRYEQLTKKLLALADQHVQKDELDPARQRLAQAEQVEAEGQRYASAAHVSRADLERVRQAIVRAQLRRDVLAEIRGLLTQPDVSHYEQAENLAQRHGFTDDPEIKKLIDGLYTSVIAQVTYSPAREPAAPVAVEDRETTLVLVPRIGEAETRSSRTAPSASGNVIFALARGYLYALDEASGSLRWATRVGIDTTTLPVRVPASSTHGEMVLLLSSDTNTLTARDALTGQALWQYPLRAPCLGRPLLVGQRAYVPTLDGQIHEFEIVAGHRLGSYRLGRGQRLTVGGAWQEGTNLLYFPADSRHVYVLDKDQKQCVAILQTGHPSGSMRGEPILTLDPAYLILTQTEGLGAMQLRAFALPIASPNQPPREPAVRVPGWSWFPPLHDPEKIVLATDAGMLGLFGINQPQNQDQPLFAYLPQEFRLGPPDLTAGRAQVVHADEHDVWVLARGHLRHLRLGLDAANGLTMADVWKQPVSLGAPLHAGQVNDSRDTLFVVTLAPDRPVCLATAVAAQSGRIRWQRQLGCLPRGEPLLLGKDVVLLDSAGGVFRFDPEPTKPSFQAQSWLLDTPPQSAPLLIAGPDGKSAYEMACVGQDTKLLVRRIEPGQAPSTLEFPLKTAPLAGTPAVGDGCLVLPLADGSLLRQPLAKGAAGELGLHWRAPGADADAPGHVVFLGGDDYLVTDGSRSVIPLHWSASQPWKVRQAAALSARIVAAPLVLPRDDKGLARVLVADAAGTLTLLQGPDWQSIRRWELGGKITAGPFLRGDHVGCVMDRSRLVWLDPSRDQPLWAYTAAGPIIGQPQLIEKMIVAADESGRIVALDPQTGQPLGNGYTLQAQVVPAATPVAFGKGRLLTPLTDGTILLLDRGKLK